LAEQYEDRARETQEKLEIMSLLGVVAGFMTHEFGVALDELQKGRDRMASLSRRDPALKASAEAIDRHIAALREFVTYTQGYIQGAMALPARVYPARPRIQQVVRVFGKYADQRNIKVEIRVPEDVVAPLVPVSLYNGIALNLYTNALKAVMAKSGRGDRRITFTARNDDTFHTLTASDTGIGIPAALRSRVFDPLFTTTSSNRDPLGSGLGLGLTLVKRAVETYGGTAEVVPPPEGFATSVRIRLPLARG
jgi:signal transduction histidine kinase